MATAADKKYKPDFVRAAFSRWFVGPESPDGEQRAFCPICEDPATSQSPSASLNPGTGMWNCLKGNHGGSIYKLAAELKKERGWNVRSAAMQGRNADKTFQDARDTGLAQAGKKAAPLPDAAKIEKWNSALLANKRICDDLMNERGFSRQTIISAEIGWDGQRYTIPVYDETGDLVNVRRYKMRASAANDKMLNIPGHGTARVYGLEEFEGHERILITEGETDKLLTKQVLEESVDPRAASYGVVTHTAGAATFRPQWGPLFAGKIVFVAYDADDGGKKGAKKVEGIVGPYAEEVYIVDIPIPVKGADLTDYLHKEGHTAEDLLDMLDELRESEPGTGVKKMEPLATSGKAMSLTESMSEDVQNEVLELTVSVSGKQAEPFTAPKTVTATCDMSKGTSCNLCPVAFSNGERTVDIRMDDTELFRFVDSGEDRRKRLLREITGARCSDRVEFDVPEDYHVEELLVQPSVDDRKDDETQQPVKRTVFSIGTYKSGVNEKVKLVGRNVTDPKTGKLRFMSWKNEPVEMDIDKFVMTDEQREMLKVFRPSDTQSPLDKCLEIAYDLSDNVTHIYGRPWLHVGIDLVFHSVLSFRVYDMPIDKGWLEMMVVGDTRTGKSEIAKQLTRHYKSGEMLSCEGMTFAGIVGGVQQIDGRWHMTWGAVPMNDRRLVVLDEVSGLKDSFVIEQMSSIRSSGVAQITKISSEQTSARTRIVWITNPADGTMLADSPDMGMSALRSVVPNNEDIARMDFVMSAAKGEVSIDLINQPHREVHKPDFSQKACETLVKWAWSLTRDQVIIRPRAAAAANEMAKKIGQEYIPEPPLIQGENVRYKLLRIAAAIAARTFSTDARDRLVVTKEHVEDAARFLDEIYGHESMGYRRKSRRRIRAQAIAEKRRVGAKAWLLENPDVLHTLRMVGGTTFRTRDFVDFGRLTNEKTQEVVQAMMKWQLIHRKTRGDMAMDTVLLSILRELEDDEEYEDDTA